MTIHNSAYDAPFTLKKSMKGDPDIIAQLQGNKCYSLAGAEYGVYKGGVWQETITTNANGEAHSVKRYPDGTVLTVRETKAPPGFKLDNTVHTITIRSGQSNVLNVADEPVFDPDVLQFVLTVRETKAPPGFKLDNTVHTITIRSGQSNVLNVADEPVFDPDVLQFEKKDPKTGLTVPQGNAKFVGAVFRWDYYDNQKWEGAPKRTWFFETKSVGNTTAGRCYYDLAHLAGGYDSDQLYFIREYGKVAYRIPVGSIRITEVKAPAGYGQIPELKATITQPTNGGKAEFKWTPESAAIVQSKDGKYLFPEPEDRSTFASISIQKRDADTGGAAPNGANFAGCEFTVYNRSANPVKIGNFPVAAPGEACYVLTLDAAGRAATGAEFPAGCEFTVYNRSANPVKIGNFPVAAPGEACYVLTLDAAGRAATGAEFPLGKYEIRETKGNAYYQCNTGWSQTFEVTMGGTTAFSFTVANTPVKGHIQLTKIDSTDGKPLTGAVFTVTHPDGHTENMVEEANGIVANTPVKGHIQLTKIDSTDGKPLTGAVFTVTHPDGHTENMVEEANGIHALRNLRYGKYTVQETKAPDGFQLDPTVYTVEITENGKVYEVKTPGYEGVANAPVPGSISIQKVDSHGNPMSGVTFKLEYSLDDGKVWKPVTSRAPDAPLTPGTTKAPDGFQLDPTVYTVEITENGKVYEVKTPGYEGVANAPVPGSISIQKVDSHGNPMSGVTFKLEYSLDDGKVWKPVTSRAPDAPLTPGTSSTPSIVDGALTTDAGGKIRFEGLRTDSQTGRVRYRLTEVATTNGHTLLAACWDCL